MHWYVARTQPKKEAYAVAALKQRGVNAYLPVLMKQRRRAGRRDWEPLFSGYVLAQLSLPSEQWLSARACPGIAYFLGQGGRPSALPEEFVPGLQARLQDINQAGGLPEFKHGQHVHIVQSSFRDYDAIFDRKLSPAGRSRVLVTVLNRLIPIELPEDYLRAAS